MYLHFQYQWLWWNWGLVFQYIHSHVLTFPNADVAHSFCVTQCGSSQFGFWGQQSHLVLRFCFSLCYFLGWAPPRAPWKSSLSNHPSRDKIMDSLLNASLSLPPPSLSPFIKTTYNLCIYCLTRLSESTCSYCVLVIQPHNYFSIYLFHSTRIWLHILLGLCFVILFKAKALWLYSYIFIHSICYI